MGQYYKKILEYDSFDNINFEAKLDFFKDYVAAAKDASKEGSDDLKKSDGNKSNKRGWRFYEVARAVVESSNGIVSDKEQLKKVCEYLNKGTKSVTETEKQNGKWIDITYKAHKKAYECVAAYFCGKIKKLTVHVPEKRDDKNYFIVI